MSDAISVSGEWDGLGGSAGLDYQDPVFELGDERADGGETETNDGKHKHENYIVCAMVSSTKAKAVPMSEEDAEIVVQYEIHKARVEEQQKINKRKRAERRVERNSIGDIGS
ncbi:hypothetical protein B9Z19DRAFT_1134102 [Tuber borchii]|uniref:Uncharacterized protein n=1 Tax=Tuber borchii TaxID=42251 RepID=A0A2T6ZEN8_TUBBO|nr:hypothetical protein B9Z19DRAFT_1134102 [Tuber borchii]